MRKAEQFNPMKNGAINLTKGQHTPSKVTNKMGAGSQMGPTIAKGFLVTGVGDTRPTGGKFTKANTAGEKRV
jgi:hypothetical protein